uniref:BHLH32 protein n=1 Tax=Stylosanthes guianensis subsp. guianensis TaxID=198726 RepID=A0AAF1C2X8_9FABA|nr:bHLH32 protein [Stylosanthes guianensis subsp. guianensis]
MGCNKGEIELGFLNMSQAEIQTALSSLFPEDFSSAARQIVVDPQNNPPTSSSSSLRSLSTTTGGSPECSSLIFTVPPVAPPGTIVPNTASALLSHPSTATPHYMFPNQEIENETLMRVFLNAISPQHVQLQNQNLPYNITVVHPESSAFRRYRTEREAGAAEAGTSLRSRQSLMKRSLSFFRRINAMRVRERIQATRPSSNTQLHHMIAERRRREKLNDNFQALRALLPHGTKKDKASILTTAKETLSSLTAEIEKLRIRNQELESRFPETKESSTTATDQEIRKTILMVPPNERFHVQISDVPQSSSSEERMVDLHVAMRGQISHIDAVVRLLEFLKLAQNVSLVSMRTNTNDIGEGNNSINQLTFRLRILEGSEWDVSAFQEAVRRVVGELVQFQ